MIHNSFINTDSLCYKTVLSFWTPVKPFKKIFGLFFSPKHETTYYKCISLL